MNYHDECKDKVLICQKQKRERKVRKDCQVVTKTVWHLPSPPITTTITAQAINLSIP